MDATTDNDCPECDGVGWTEQFDPDEDGGDWYREACFCPAGGAWEAQLADSADDDPAAIETEA